MTFVRTPATPRKPFGSALSSLGPPFPPFGLPANQESFHFYLGSSTFWEPAQQGASGDFAEDVKATPLRMLCGTVADVLIISLAVIDQRVWRYLGARGRKGHSAWRATQGILLQLPRRCLRARVLLMPARQQEANDLQVQVSALRQGESP